MTTNTVLVTGGTRGIGLAITRQLLEANYSVHILAREPTSFDLISASGKSLPTFHSVDLTDSTALNTFIRTFDYELVAIVNNAGSWAPDPIQESSTWLLQELFRLNVEAPYALTRGLASRLVDGGRIVNISSQLGSKGRAAMGAYSATKHALNGLTRCWALDLAGRRICVNAVAPGWVDTESNASAFALEAERTGKTAADIRNDLEASLPLLRMITEYEVASLVQYLVSPAASGITGQVYEIK